MKMQAFLNGRFVDDEEAWMPTTDRGLLSGYGLFETMRARSGRVFRLDAHYRRLLQGTLFLDLGLPLAVEELGGLIDELTRRNELRDARIRLTITAGTPGESGTVKPSVLLTARPIADYPRSLYSRGMTAIVSHIRRNEWSPSSRIKSLSRLDSVLAREEARRAGADEALLLNTTGAIAEGSASNLFVFRSGHLLTPATSCGALPGITRAAVLDLAHESGIDTLEGVLSPEVPLDADEAFLTGAVMGVMPLTKLNGQPIGNGRPGAVTALLQRLYQEAATQESTS
jgi:branched-chain amino acid aminotransferase